MRPRSDVRARMAWWIHQQSAHLAAAAKDVFRAFLRDRAAVAIAALSAIATAIYQASETFWWGGSDHLGHLLLAYKWLGIADGAHIPYRTPGMAMFLVLTGVPIFDSWAGLIAAYALLGIGMPLLVYYALAPYSRAAAIVAAAAILGSGLTLGYSKTGNSEQLFHFLHFLCICFAARYFHRPSGRILGALTVGLFALCLVRPVAALYFWVFVFVALIVASLQRRSLRPLVLATLAYMGFMAAWALAGRHYGADTLPASFGAVTRSDRAIGEVYFGSPEYSVTARAPAPAISPSAGPASAELFRVLQAHVVANAAKWETSSDPYRPKAFFAAKAADPRALAQEILSRPNFVYFDAIRVAARDALGPRADELLMEVAGEHGAVGIGGAFRYLRRNPIRLLVGGVPPFGNWNFLGLFLQTRLRYQAEPKRMYSLTAGTVDIDLEASRMYASSPTPERLRAVAAIPPLSAVDIVLPSNGPATRELLAASRLFIDNFPAYWEDSNPWLAEVAGRPDELQKRIFYPEYAQETGIYQGFLYDAMTKYFGFARADRLYNQVAWEAVRAYPFSLAIIWDNALRIMLIRTFGDIRSRLSEPPYSLWGDILYMSRRTDYTSLPPGLARELPREIWPTETVKRIAKAYAVAHLVSFAFVIVSAIVLIPALLSRGAPFVAFLALAYAYHVAVISVYGNFGAPRYYDVFAWIPMLIAVLGTRATLAMAANTWKRRHAG